MWIVPTVDGGGEAVFVIPPEVSDEQVGALAQTYDGELGGMPWVPCTGAH